MAKIIIKRREDPIFLENERAQKLKIKWLDDATPRSNRVDLGNWSGTYEDIKSIEIESEKSKRDKFTDNIAEHNKMRREFLAYPDEVKASHLAMFKMYFQGAMDRKPTEEEISRAKELQLEFYKAHPKRMRVDVKIFDELIPNEKARVTGWGSKCSYQPRYSR